MIENFPVSWLRFDLMDIGVCDSAAGLEFGARVNGLWLEKAKGISLPLQKGSAKKCLSWHLFFCKLSWEGHLFGSLILLFRGTFWKFLTSNSDLNICQRNAEMNESLISNTFLIYK